MAMWWAHGRRLHAVPMLFARQTTLTMHLVLPAPMAVVAEPVGRTVIHLITAAIRTEQHAITDVMVRTAGQSAIHQLMIAANWTGTRVPSVVTATGFAICR